jgi:hypothetical protein
MSVFDNNLLDKFNSRLTKDEEELLDEKAALMNLRTCESLKIDHSTHSEYLMTGNISRHSVICNTS